MPDQPKSSDKPAGTGESSRDWATARAARISARRRAEELAARSLALSLAAKRARDAQFPAWWTQELLTELKAIQKGRQGASTMGSVSVSIYLEDEGIHEQVEEAIEHWLATGGISIDTRDDPVIGSWFRQMSASWKKVVKKHGREVLLTATHAADSHLVQAQDARVTATLLQSVGPVLQALQPTKDAVVRAGALVIVKVDWVVQVYQLTAAQQAILDHMPHLAASPKEIITALGSPEPVSQDAALQPAATPQLSTGTTTTPAN